MLGHDDMFVPWPFAQVQQCLEHSTVVFPTEI